VSYVPAEPPYGDFRQPRDLLLPVADATTRQRLADYRLRDYGQARAVLRQARKGCTTQDALAAKLGIVQSQVSDWETGRSVPLATSLFALAAALGYDLALIPRENTP
jgi:DNA-binding XRE family transcriptional regulator